MSPKRSADWPRPLWSAADISEIHIACEDYDFAWTDKQVQRFLEMWRSGLTIRQIAEHFDRDPDEVVLLVMDQAKLGNINPRPGGILGALGA
ncbi:helix-turn-helix domain containing protein [Saccharibacillus brassicae]|uniref:Helix-turn-helix domain containing protein n=1 Tax=Saccharibacillus brassicae TaxID=2583377 RepID=A0A4Y6V0D7_SACBS|nr:helix-turn-helix domain containing protein [Saccharibacillus brassicae]QDH23489.1 helix-turn-helix domain containing protein [Saccharibacillus brassicae]